MLIMTLISSFSHPSPCPRRTQTPFLPPCSALTLALSCIGSGAEDSGSDASQLSGDSDIDQDDSDLEDEDDDPLAGATFDMSDDEAAEDQSIPSGDDDSPDESSPEDAAEAQGRAEHKADGLGANGD